MGYANLSEPAIDEGVRRLAEVLARALTSELTPTDEPTAATHRSRPARSALRARASAHPVPGPPPAGGAVRRAWPRAPRRAARARSASAAHRRGRRTSRATSARCSSPTAATARPCRRPCGRRRRRASCMCAPSAQLGKLKRLRNDARLLVAPCTVRGKPLGAPFEARAQDARAGARSRSPSARSAARYGLGRELFERTMDLLRVDMCFLEITPGRGSAAARWRLDARRARRLRRARWPRAPSAASASARAARRRRTRVARSRGSWSNAQPHSRRFSKQRTNAVSERLGVIRPTACCTRSIQRELARVRGREGAVARERLLARAPPLDAPRAARARRRGRSTAPCGCPRRSMGDSARPSRRRRTRRPRRPGAAGAGSSCPGSLGGQRRGRARA